MKLYEIGNKYLELLQKIEAGEIEEDYIADTLESVEGEFEEKADNIASFIKSLLCEAVALKEEAENLTARRKAKETKAESLRVALENMMQRTGIKKVETTRNVLTVKKNPASVILEKDFELFADEEWLRVKTVVEADKTKIASYLRDGNDIKGASLKQSEKLQIK